MGLIHRFGIDKGSLVTGRGRSIDLIIRAIQDAGRRAVVEMIEEEHSNFFTVDSRRFQKVASGFHIAVAPHI